MEEITYYIIFISHLPTKDMVFIYLHWETQAVSTILIMYNAVTSTGDLLYTSTINTACMIYADY